MTTDGINASGSHHNPMGLRLEPAYTVRTKPAASIETPPPTPIKNGLTAGKVPGAVRFDEGLSDVSAAAKPDALPFYTRPGDVNAAATGIHAGRSLDIEG